VSVTGSASNDYLFTFTNPGSAPQVTGYVDADAAIYPIIDGGDQTAFSDALDGPAITAADQNAPAALTTDVFGNLVAGGESVPDSGGGGNGSEVNLPGVVSWAKAHAYPGTKKDHPFTPDCTDFASRAVHIGGGLPFNIPNDTSFTNLESKKSHLNYWFNYHGHTGFIHWTVTSYSWADAHNLATFFNIQGAYFMKFGRSSGSTSNVKAGMVIFGAMNGGGFGKIDHTGVVTKVTGRNIMITQHSVNRYNEPLWAISTKKSWFGRSPKLEHVWIVLPHEND
jgi:hypothetical protein